MYDLSVVNSEERHVWYTESSICRIMSCSPKAEASTEVCSRSTTAILSHDAGKTMEVVKRRKYHKTLITFLILEQLDVKVLSSLDNLHLFTHSNFLATPSILE